MGYLMQPFLPNLIVEEDEDENIGQKKVWRWDTRFDYLADLLKKGDSLIGSEATIKYFSLTPDGVPRFPYVIAIRDYE